MVEVGNKLPIHLQRWITLRQSREPSGDLLWCPSDRSFSKAMKWKETTAKIYTSSGQALVFDTLNWLEITRAFSSFYENWLNKWLKCSKTLLFFRKKVTRNIWTTITFFRSIKKPGSTSLTASSQLNENILHKTGIEVLPAESLQPWACGIQAHLPKTIYVFIERVSFRFNSNFRFYQGFR